MIDPQKVRLAYYESGDGPRIMLFGPSQVELQALQDCFSRLSKDENSIDLHEQPFVHIAGDIQLRLQSVGSAFGKKNPCTLPGLRRNPEHSNSFIWTRTGEGWDYLAELIDSSVRAVTPGHQYLTSYPSEDAIVVVSKGEYGDEVLDR
ncbi:hypothetical protein DTL42_17160 [Bremerella cremea]|uniref:Uncharacterized protein n=1 Tax=Bremerella cremea TaxID=1031537 RepID=A0A368KNC1_9BACT|nr:hypothetical protein [Bremerella cremea]RCS44651.1 hypothetical protein DTL42_17160 [Bremerella cremea]